MRATYGCLYFPCCSIVRLRLIPAATSQPDPYSYDRRPASTPPSGLTPCPLLPRRQGGPSNAKCREDEPSPLSANGATTILPFIPSRHAMPPSPFSSIARSPARRSLSHRLLEAKAGVVSSPRTRKACLIVSLASASQLTAVARRRPGEARPRDRRGTLSCGRGGHTPRPWCAPSRHPPLPSRRVASPRLRPMHHGPRHAVNTAPREVWLLRARAILRARAML